LRLEGHVIHGFARGKDLGFPTANLSNESFESLFKEEDYGVYFGFSQIENEPIERMVMSIGTNPQYGNNHTSVEVHVLKNYENDFYDRRLKLIIVGFLRTMKKFNSLDELIEEINNDVKKANETLDGLTEENTSYITDSFWNPV